MEPASALEDAAVDAVRWGSPTPTWRSPGNYAIQGNYNGYQVWDISDPRKPTLKTAYVCPASQSDVSVYKNLLFVSGENLSARLDCGTQGVEDTVSTERLRGIRIFDISDISQPEERRQRADLPRLAHPHGAGRSEGPRERLRLHLGLVRRAVAQRAARLRERARTDPNSALFRIEVIKVPLAHPEQAAIVSSPRIFNDLVAPPEHGEAPEDIAAQQEGRWPRPRPRAAFTVVIEGEEEVVPPEYSAAMLDSIVKARRRHRRADGGRQRGAAAGAPRRWLPRWMAAARRPRCRTPTPGPPSATTSPSIRPSGWPAAPAGATACCSTSAIPAQPGSHRRRGRLELLLLALGDVQQRRHQDPLLRRVGRRRHSRSAARPTSRSGAPTPSSRSTNRKMEFQSYYKLPAPQTAAGELRGPQRVADPDSRVAT